MRSEHSKCPTSPRRPTYRVVLYGKILMKDGKPCEEQITKRATIKEPALAQYYPGMACGRNLTK